MTIKNDASTPVDELHRQRQQREQRRAAERGRDMHRSLVERGKESSTSHGAVLMKSYGETLCVALDALLTKLIGNPELAGRHYGAWPLHQPAPHQSQARG